MRKFLLLISIAVISSFSASSQDYSNKGRDFWVCYPAHINTTASVMGIYITSDVNATGTIKVGAVSIPFTVVANQVTYKFIGPNGGGSAPNTAVYLTSQDGIQTNSGIHITSDKNVAVYAHIIYAARSGATLVLPTKVWGLEYVAPSHQNQGTTAGYGEITVMAALPNTTVEINPATATRSGFRPAGTPFQITLANPGDVYQLQFASAADMSGTTIKSVTGSGGCKPIAVYSATTWTGLGCSGASGGDNLFQQLFPKSAWGKQFLTAPLKKVQTNGADNNIDSIRVFVTDPTTVVTKIQNGVTSTLAGLRSGGFYAYAASVPTYLEADKPIQVVQYITSQTCGNPGTQSDPEMVILNAVEQTINDITVFSAHQNYVPPGQSQVTTHYLNIIMKTSNTGTFKINGNAPVGSFTAIPGTLYSFLKEDVTSKVGLNPISRLTADSGFSAIAYGFGDVESYGYNAGTNVKDLYQQISVNTQYGIETTPSVCTGTPFTFKISLPYCVDSLAWDFSSLPGAPSPAHDTTRYTICGVDPTPNMGADSTTYVNGKTLYWYHNPNTFSLSPQGTYPVVITAFTKAGVNPCGNEQDIPFDLIVSDPPVASFTYTAGGCYAEPYVFKETTPQTPKPTYKLWWEFYDPNVPGVYNVITGNNSPSASNPGRTVSFTWTTPGLGKRVRFTSITTPGCLSDTLVQYIDVPDLPNASISSTGLTACINTTGPDITFTGTDGTKPYKFYYHIESPASGPALNVNSVGTTASSAPITVPTNVAGTFKYVLDSVRNVGSTACVRIVTGQSVTVTITPDATIALTTTPTPSGNPIQTVCINNAIVPISYDLGGSATGAAPDVTSTFPPGVTGSVVGTKYVILGTPTVAGVYNFQINSQGPCLKPFVTGKITVNDDATISSSPANATQTVCINKPILNILFTVGSNTTSVVVSPPLPPGLTGTLSGTTYTIQGTPTVAGSYTYTVKANGPCLSATSASATITITPDAYATFTSGPGTDNQTVCLNSAINMITYGWGGSATSLTWSGLPTGVTASIVGGNHLEIIGSPSVPGSFTYHIVPVGPCEIPELTGKITVKDLPTATISQSLTEACLNSSPAPTVTFTGGTGTAPYKFTYTVTIGAGAPSAPITVNGTTNYVITVPTNVATTYKYDLIGVQEGSANACVQNTLPPTSASVTINPLPGAAITGSAAVCLNSSPGPLITFTGSGATAPYEFTYTIDAGSGPGAPIVVNSPATGIYTFNAPTNVPGIFIYKIIKVTDLSTGCSTIPNVGTTIQVKDLPSATLSTNAAQVCENGTPPVITFTGSGGTPPYQFTYTIDPGTGPGAPIVATSPGVSSVYTVTAPTNVVGTFTYNLLNVKENSGITCDRNYTNTVTTQVKVNPSPTASVAVNAISACRNDAPAPIVTFTGANGTPPYKFTYTINGVTQAPVYSVFPSSSAPVPVSTAVASATPFRYQLVSVSDGTLTACSQTQTGFVDVTINELPTPDFTISVPNCESQTITFTSTSSAGSGTINPSGITWNFGDATSPSNTAIGLTATHTYLNPGSYTVTMNAQNSNGCTNAAAKTQTFTVHPNPVADFTFPPGCVDDNITFTSTSTPAANISSWAWDYNDPTSPNPTGTGATSVHKFTAFGTYDVQLTVTTIDGCKNTQHYPVIINAANPTASAAITNSAALCSSDSVVLTDNSKVQFGSLTKIEIYWDNVGGSVPVVTVNSPVFGAIYKHKYPTLQTNQNFVVRIRAYSGSLCYNDWTQNITVYATPKVAVANYPDVCWDAAPFQLTQGSEVGGLPNGKGVYTSPDPGISGPNSDIFNPKVAGIGTHIIKYTWTAIPTGCLDSMSKTIIVRDTAHADFSYVLPVCVGSSISFKDESTAPAGNLQTIYWDFGDVPGAPLTQSAPGASVTHTYLLPNTYTVTQYNVTADGCKSLPRSKQVTISPVPTTLLTPDQTSLCLPNAKATFTNHSFILGNGPLIYNWDYGDPASGNNTSTGVNGSHVYTGVGPYIVTLTATSGSGCSTPFTFPVTYIHPQPKADYSTNKPSLCKGDDVTFTDITDPTPGASTITRVWDLGDGTPSSAPSVTHTYSTVDSFYVKLYTINSFGCHSDTTNVPAEIRPFAVYDFPTVNAGADRYVLEGGSITFNPIVSGQNLSYLWTPSTYLNNPTLLKPTASLIKNDITYTLTVTGIGNCPYSDAVFIKVLKFPEIPNTFTPNNDGINDLWKIQYLDTYPDNRVQVFTRTGQLVFESHGYSKPWDGTKAGKPLPVDTYYYIIEPGNGRDPIKGYVTIIK